MTHEDESARRSECAQWVARGRALGCCRSPWAAGGGNRSGPPPRMRPLLRWQLQRAARAAL